MAAQATCLVLSSYMSLVATILDTVIQITPNIAESSIGLLWLKRCFFCDSFFFPSYRTVLTRLDSAHESCSSQIHVRGQDKWWKMSWKHLISFTFITVASCRSIFGDIRPIVIIYALLFYARFCAKWFFLNILSHLILITIVEGRRNQSIVWMKKQKLGKLSNLPKTTQLSGRTQLTDV